LSNHYLATADLSLKLQTPNISLSNPPIQRWQRESHSTWWNHNPMAAYNAWT